MKFFPLKRLPLPLQLVLLLGCLLPILWSLIFFDLHRLHEQTRSLSRAHVDNLARAFAEEVKSSISSIDLTLVELRDEWQGGYNDFSQAVRRRQTYLEKDIGFQVAIINAAGLLVYSSVDVQPSSMNLGDREHFKAHRGLAFGDRLFISKPVLGRVSQRWSIQFTRPLIDASGNFSGVIVLSVSPDYFSRFYTTIDLGKDSSITLARTSGEVLAQSPNPENGMGKIVSRAPFLGPVTMDHGQYEGSSDFDRVERLFSWRVLPKEDLVVVVGQSLDTILATYRQQRQASFVSGAGISILLAAIGYFLLVGIRQRFLANAALVESEARWKFALEGAAEGVWDWDVQTDQAQFSRRWKEILGFSENEIGNRVDEWTARIHPDDKPSFMEELRSHLSGATPTYNSEHRMQCRDGSWKWVLERGMVVSHTSSGQPLRMVGTFSDITERKQGETDLKESMDQLAAEQRRMKSILESSHDAFVAVDPQGRITDWNTRAELTFGWTAAEVIGRDLVSIIIPEEQRQGHNAGFKRFAETGKSSIINRVIEVEAVHRNGNRIPIELAVAGFFDGEGYAANAFIRDISERKKAEQLDIERMHALEQSRRALQQAQKLEALGRLTGGIAHDFNNILQTLTTGVQVALFSAKDKGAQSALEACQRAVERGVQLTRQLLVFGRVQDVHLKTVHPALQMQDMYSLIRGALPSNIDLRMDVGDTLWPVRIDPLQFELAMLNLAMNARDAMTHGGQLNITGGNETIKSGVHDLKPGDYVRLVITDSGEGMTEEVLAKALDPFFTTKAVGKGSGMGLAQAYGFAKQMGGTLTLQSNKEEGLTVSIYLPREMQEALSSVPKIAASIPAAESGGSILLVEDDPLVRQTVQPALREAGFTVSMADNGEDAVRYLESGQQIDLVFSDIVMPGAISGIDLAKIIRTRYPKVQIVLATGYSERRVESAGVRTLAKPYSVSALVAALNDELYGAVEGELRMPGKPSH
jgi:PAS domain S-box-containing protein